MPPMSINDDDAIKSVERVFAVLSWFDEKQVPAGATQIARSLEYPLSSTTAILKSMRSCGYLAFDPLKRRYFPTMRITNLGAWIGNHGVVTDDLSDLVDEVGAATGESVSLSCQNDLEMLFVKVRRGDRQFGLEMEPGECAPLFCSTIGLTALSRLPDRDIAKLMCRYNRRTFHIAAKANPTKTLDQIHHIRMAGYGIGYDMCRPSVGAVAWALPPRANAHAMVLAIGGPTARVRAEEREIVEVGGSVVRRYLDRINHQQ